MRRAEEVGCRPIGLLQILAVRSAIAAHVEHEDVEQRPIGNFAIDSPGLGLREAQRHVFMKYAVRPRRQQQRIRLDVFAALVLSAGQRLAWPPVVGHFVIVPLRKNRYLSVESEHVLVKQIVFVIAAELRERLRGLRLFLDHDVFPNLAIRHFFLGEYRDIGIDRISAVDEEIRPITQDGGVGAHAAARLVDAPALPGGICRPNERDRASVARRRAEAADHWLAGNGGRREVLEADAVENVLPCGQSFDQCLCREIGFGQRVDENRAVDDLEAVGRRDLGQHAGRTIGARPDHGGIDRDVAGLDAVGDERAIGGAAQVRLGEAADGGNCGRGRAPSPKSAGGTQTSACSWKRSELRQAGEDAGQLSHSADGRATPS